MQYSTKGMETKTVQQIKMNVFTKNLSIRVTLNTLL